MNTFRSNWLKLSSQKNKCCCHFEKQMLSHHIYCFTVKTILQKTNLSEVWRTPSDGGDFLRVTKEYPWRKAGLRNLKNSTEKQANSQKAHSLIHISKKRPHSPPVKHGDTSHLSCMKCINQMLSACHHEATTEEALSSSSRKHLFNSCYTQEFWLQSCQPKTWHKHFKYLYLFQVRCLNVGGSYFASG